MLEWCEHCEAPMSEDRRFPVAELGKEERAEYRHNGRVAIVALAVGYGDWRMCSDCRALYEEG